IEIGDDLDISTGKHAFRTGLLFEGGRYHTDERRNATGTFTFSDLNAFAAGLPTTFTRNAGDPRAAISQIQTGLYVQDDYRAAKALTISGGVRQEYQSNIGGWNLGPRGSIAWSPFKSGKTTVRAGGGVFFDWFDAQNYEQAVQLDGTHQQIDTIVRPGFPEPASGGGALVLPPGRVQLAANLEQPELREAMAGVERQLSPDLRWMARYIQRGGVTLRRGVNINAPAGGVRPDPASGVVTSIDSTASSRVDSLNLNVNFMKPQRRLFIVAGYTLSRAIDET